MSEAQDKIPIYFDIDGYVGPTDEVAPRPSARPSSRLGSPLQELSMIHYLLRSPIVLGSDFPQSSWPQFQRFSQECAAQAERLVGNWGNVPNPAWIGDFRKALKSSGKADVSAIEDISVSCVLTPKIYAYCFPVERCIEVSAIAREHMRTINLLLWTMAGELSRSNRPLGEIAADKILGDEIAPRAEQFLDLVLPFLFSLYFANVNYSYLPIMRVVNPDDLLRAQVGALIQVQFLLAHEYAHLLLHGERPSHPDLEREADTFAYELLFETEEFQKNDYGICFTSCRWFFLYLTLDRIIGAVLSGYAIDWVDLPIRNREMWMYKRARNIKFRSEEERDCQFWGDALLFQAKLKLQERGTDWIRSAAREFEMDHCFAL